MKDFIKTLWKTQPDTVLGGASAMIYVSDFFVLNYFGQASTRALKTCNDASMLAFYEVPKDREEEITNPKWLEKISEIKKTQEKRFKNEQEALNKIKKLILNEIEYMKACAKQVRIERVNWYIDEMGIEDNFERIRLIENTDLFMSNKPYKLMEEYKSRGISPKIGKDLPYYCVPDAKDKSPKDFLQRFVY